jgi:murein DD-endopeptidase MepM/ murein hydrolase activator NlpD
VLRSLSLIILSFGLVACTPADTDTQTTLAPVAASATPVDTFTPIPTAIVASATSTVTSTATITPTLRPTQTTTNTPLPPTNTFAPTDVVASATPLPATIMPTESVMQQIDHYVLRRPIERSSDLRDWVDRTYPYGGTQFGTREVHLGVEFVNPRFTLVLAASEGVVAFAGTDDERLIGPSLNYYGNVVIVEHPLQTPDGLSVFTVYAHLQSISVAVGDIVEAGDTIGQIGDTGIAIGPHLHFEVRVGEAFDHRATRNPELWLRPYPQFGTLAGRVMGLEGESLQGVTLFVRSNELNRETYTYGSDRVNASTSWNENFTLGDLPVGNYEMFISIPNGRVLFRQDFEITNGVTTFIEATVDDSLLIPQS